MNKIQIMYRQYKEGAITEEILMKNLLEIMINSEETEHLLEEGPEIIHLRKEQSLHHMVSYVLNIQLRECTIMGSIKINKDFGSVL